MRQAAESFPTGMPPATHSAVLSTTKSRHLGHTKQSLQAEQLDEKIIPLSYFSHSGSEGSKKLRKIAKNLSDRKSVIRETRDDVIRISSES